MKRWSKLQKELYRIIDRKIDFQIHCAAYRMRSQRGSTALPRYWITLGGTIIFDYPKQFVDKQGDIRTFSGNPADRNSDYPYKNDTTNISRLIREYIDTPVTEIMSKQFENDVWGLANILRAADSRIGTRRLDTLRRRKGGIAAQKVIAARQNKSRK